MSGPCRRWPIVCGWFLGIAAAAAGAATPAGGQCDPWGSCPIAVGAPPDNAATGAQPSRHDASWPPRGQATAALPDREPGIAGWLHSGPESDPTAYPAAYPAAGPPEAYPALTYSPYGLPAPHVAPDAAPPERPPTPAEGVYAFPATIPPPGDPARSRVGPAGGFTEFDLAEPAPASRPSSGAGGSSSARTFGDSSGGSPSGTATSGALWTYPGSDGYTWQVLPSGLLFKSYLAGGRESRFATRWVYVRGQGWLWDSTLGGRVGILRYGTEDPTWPEGWQIDIEGAAFPRLDPEEHRDLISSDFRFGVPLTWRRGNWEWKFGYYHLSSHLADEYMLKNPRPRINYSRDCLVLGIGWHPWPAVRLYAETEYAFWYDGGAKPWAFQFGAEFSPVGYTGIRGAPFWAVNGRLREENDFGGNVTFQAGWQWRGPTGHLFRLGLHYFNGMSDEYQFFREHEDQVGVGLWYDY